eukprot:c17634_g1_i3.p1 GENE.c17634_g1_i3~~c17634_g1_i3.p1  ORF type:complete len:169 (+),score=43.67 c17634_g1_i3:78-509(+)
MSLLLRLLGDFGDRPGEKDLHNVFVSSTAVSCSLADLEKRFATYLHCSGESFVAAAVLAVRLWQTYPEIFSPRTLHKLLAGLLVVAVKLTDDRHKDNRFFAACSGVTLKEMNTLERVVLGLLDFNVFVDGDQCVELESKLTLE